MTKSWEETAQERDAAVDRFIHEFAKATGVLWCVEHLNNWLVRKGCLHDH